MSVLSAIKRTFRRRAPAAAPTVAQPAAVVPPPTLESETRAAAASLDAWIEARLRRTAMYSTPSSGVLERLRASYPDEVESTLQAAERVLTHEFDLLGSGPFRPVDPDRPLRDGYAPIDWQLDPVRGLRFPRGFPYKKWDLAAMRPANADVKYPWEIGRCQHWVPLGQAFLLTGDDRFGLEISRQLDDFVEVNPIGVGVNWTCTMDVGLRAVSWAMALEMIHGCGAVEPSFWRRAYGALFDHGVFIRNNLENTYEVTSNHFLSDLLGLLFVAAAFRDLPSGVDWDEFARSSIEHELDVQVLADGADYESSIPYHRLVAELFLGAARLAELQAAPPGDRYRARLRGMVEYLAAVMRPDGLMPQVGDADDGRLHVVSGYGSVSPQDARHLLGVAGRMFDVPEWRAVAGPRGAWEAEWWGLDSGGSSVAADPRQTPSVFRLFPDAGIAVARTMPDGHYLIVTNGIVGTNGFGNHKHNDLLSFEYHRDGAALMVDPGSYVYTSDADARNRFRSTPYHNTVMVDGTEQNELRPDYLFRMFEAARPEVVSFAHDEGVVEYEGRHHGYERLPDPVTHERTLRFDRRTGGLAIVDRLAGRGRHDVRWHFHLAPGVAAALADPQRIVLTDGGRAYAFNLPPDLTARIQPAEYSPSYGVRRACVAVDLATTAILEGAREWEFSIA